MIKREYKEYIIEINPEPIAKDEFKGCINWEIIDKKGKHIAKPDGEITFLEDDIEDAFDEAKWLIDTSY